MSNGQRPITAAAHNPAGHSVWPGLLARCLVVLTFPLICLGGLVTTHQAGMAVPDWPGTFGYNLWLYPWETWFFGPWDIFVEHGHRLMGTLVGLTAILLLVSTIQTRQPAWIVKAAAIALGLVILQGLLGGARVVLDQRSVAMVHGCFGPAFFAYAAWLTQWLPLRSQRREDARQVPPKSRVSGGVAGSAVALAVVCYVQLILGAQLRHISALSSVDYFRAAVFFHLLGAVVVTAAVVRMLWLTWGRERLAAWGKLLFGMLVLQVTLGVGAWLAKYNWPDGLAHTSIATPFTIEAGGMLQSVIVTSHVAVGSLIVASSVVLATRALQKSDGSLRVASRSTLAQGVA